jgi:hypothetical protein
MLEIHATQTHSSLWLGIAAATTLAGPALAQPESRSWNRPIEGFVQKGCFRDQDRARTEIAAYQRSGLETRLLYKPGPECWSIHLPDQMLPTLTYQVGAFAIPENARKVADSLGACGYQPKVTEIAGTNGNLYRVRVQVSSDRNALDTFRRCLESNPYVPDEAELISE